MGLVSGSSSDGVVVGLRMYLMKFPIEFQWVPYFLDSFSSGSDMATVAGKSVSRDNNANAQSGLVNLSDVNHLHRIFISLFVRLCYVAVNLTYV